MTRNIVKYMSNLHILHFTCNGFYTLRGTTTVEDWKLAAFVEIFLRKKTIFFYEMWPKFFIAHILKCIKFFL